jgi:hypothetical protein
MNAENLRSLVAKHGRRAVLAALNDLAEGWLAQVPTHR